MTTPRFFAVIPAAGVGARMEAACPKQYLDIAGKPVLRHVLDTFAAVPRIEHTFVVVSESDGYIGPLMEHAGLHARVTVLTRGGATRQKSVLGGLMEISGRVAAEDWVLVHDAARPGLTVELIDRLLDTLKDDPVGGLLALPLVDTVKRADSEERSIGTVPRSDLWGAQTPQMFRYALLRDALEQTDDVTDEAGAIEAIGLRPRLVPGSRRNFKLTLPEDTLLAEHYLGGPEK